MRLLPIAERLRRPTVIAASIGVIGASMVSTGATTQERPTTVMRRVVATPVPLPTFAPKTLVIPAIDVDAPVVPVGTEPDGKMASPGTAEDVGWWYGRKAGKGNLLLDGHHDWNGRLGVFYDLAKLKKGDKVVVQGDSEHKILTYEIVWIKNYDRNIDATDLLGNKTKQQMATLITCGGTFDTIARTHRERIVARAHLVTT